MSELEKLRAEFLAESEETLEALQRDVNRLAESDRPLSTDVLDRVFRTAHSLKGVCGMFGLTDMQDVAHALENVFEALRSERVEPAPELADLLFRGIEALHGLLARATGKSEGIAVGGTRELRDAIDSYLRENARAPEGADDDDPLPAMLRLLTASERTGVSDAARSGRTLAIVQATFPEEGFQRPFRDLLSAAREWGTVHGTVSDPPLDAKFRLRCVMSGTDGIFHLLKAVGPHGAEVFSCDAAAALDEEGDGRGAVPAASLPIAAPLPPPDPPQEAFPAREVPPLPREPDSEATDSRIAPPPRPIESAPASGGTLRVPVERVDQLLSDLGDVIHAKMSLDAAASGVLEGAPDRLKRTELTQSLRNLDRRIRTLQDEVLRVRMISLGSLFQKLERALREACRLTGKEARLVTEGKDVELDKSIVESLAEPLVHLIRNAVDHGLEDGLSRARAGKDPVGTVLVSAASEGGRTLLEVRDDGAGLDFDRILEKARESGLVADHENVSRGELRDIIFRPGFTVRDQADALSGRGVGLDAVRGAVAELGGVLFLDDRGEGTGFRMRIPTTLAVAQALLVETADQPYFVPLGAVTRVVQVGAREIEDVGGEEILLVDEQAVPVRDLSALLGGEPQARDRDRIPGVVLALADRRLLLLVGRLGPQREIVVRPVGGVLPTVPGVAGSTELEDGRTVLILDPGALFDRAHRSQRVDSRS